MRSFARWPIGELTALPAAPGSDAVPAAEPLPAAPTGTRFTRRRGVGARRVGDDIFLTDAATRRIHRLNATGGIVWSLLAEPMTGTDLAEALRILYPGVPGDRLEADLAALLAALRADCLIEVERQP
jgi:hypothetical protein